MRGEKTSFLAVVIILIAISAYISYSGNQAIADSPPEICKISGELWDYAANDNFPPFDCCTGLIACSDGHCCEAGIAESVVTGQIAGMVISQPVKEFIAPSPEPVGIEYECYINSDCGTSTWTGNPYCQNSNVFQNYRTYACENPGTPFASCVQLNQGKIKQSCGNDIDGDWITYCKDSNVWESKTISEKGCLDGFCFTNTEKSDKMVRSCTDCSDGECVGESESITYTINDYIPNNPEPDPVIEPNPVSEHTCGSDSDCGNDQWVRDSYCQNDNIYRDYRTYTCNNPGTDGAYCTYSDKSNFVEECEDDCENGACATLLTIAAYTCDQDSDCGTDGWLGSEYCTSEGGDNTDIADTWRDYTCHYPGTPSAYCTNSDEEKIKEDCGDSSCDSWGNPYCYDNDVWHSRQCNSRGCEGGPVCYDGQYTDDEKVQECGTEGCTGGQCNTGTIECYDNSDCSADAWVGSPYCQSGDVWQAWRDWSCQNPGTTNSDCVYTDSQKKKEDCSNGCTSGQCNAGNIECNTNSDCGTNTWVGSPYCQSGDVWQAWRTYICSNPGTVSSDCSNSDQNKKKEDCASGCTNGQCNGGGTHTVCDYSDKTCETVNSAGTDECSVYSDCTHTECDNNECVDVDSQGVDECTTNNDCTSGGDKPDLTVTNLRVMWPSEPKVGDIITFEFTIKNIGKADANDFKFNLANGGYSWSPAAISLGVNKDIEIYHEHIYDNEGSYSIRAIADSTNKISESNENNNQKEITVFVSESGTRIFDPIKLVR